MKLRTSSPILRKRAVRRGPALIGVLLALGGSAAHAEGVVHVPAEVSVDAPLIELGDIAVFDGISPEVERRLAAIAFGPASEPVLAGERVRQAVRAVDADLWVDVPEHIAVRRTAQNVSRAELQERIERAIRHRMPWPADAVTLHSWGVPDAMTGPLGATRLLVSFRAHEDFRGRVSVDLDLVDPERPEKPGTHRSASVELEVRVAVAVAARKLQRGETLQADAIRFEPRELRRLPNDVVTGPEQALGQRLLVTVREGSPLLFGYLAQAPVVKRGDALLVEAGRDQLDVRVEARALEAGAVGQVIRARNPASRREFQVEVTGPREARLATGSAQ